MSDVIFIQPDGASVSIEVPEGYSIMEAAVRNGVDGVEASCGGACACATCHVYVDPEWLTLLPPVSSSERAMLEFAHDVREGSRLSCQIKMEAALDGMKVHVAKNDF